MIPNKVSEKTRQELLRLSWHLYVANGGIMTTASFPVVF